MGSTVLDLQRLRHSPAEARDHPRGIMKVVEYYSEPGSFGPYYKVVDEAGKTVPKIVEGVPYPADGFSTHAQATRWMERQKRVTIPEAP